MIEIYQSEINPNDFKLKSVSRHTIVKVKWMAERVNTVMHTYPDTESAHPNAINLNEDLHV